MNDTHKVQLSSLLDNELDLPEAKSLVKVIENDRALNKQLDRYALIRDALNEDVVVYQESFLKSVQDALVTEPTVLAASHKKPENKSYVALALAASVAIFTVIIFNIGLFSAPSEGFQTVASVEAEQDKMLVLDEQADKDLRNNETNLEAQLVTFEK